MKILAVISGVGYGDATRDYSVLKEFSRRKKAEIKVIAYDKSYEFFKDKFDTIKISGYKFSGYNLKFQFFPFFILNFLLPFLWIIHAFRIKRKLKDFKPDIILNNLEPIGIILAKLYKKKCFMVFGYDLKLYEDYKKYNDVGIKQRLQNLYVKFLYDNKDIKLILIPRLLQLGNDYGKFRYISAIVRSKIEELDDKKIIMKRLKLKRSPIILMLGGSKFGLTLANRLLRVIKDIDEDFIIFGYSADFKRENIKAYEFREDFLDFLKISKGVVTLAGYNTMAECLSYKKPMLIFPIEDHIEQLLNVYNIGKFAMIGDNVEESVKKFINNIKDLQKKLDNLNIKADGSEEAVNIILKNLD